MAPKLEGKVALVADATRGAGRGIAVDLGAAGPTVYATGRSGMEAGPGGQPDIARKPPGYGAPGGFYITPWADRVQLIDAKYVGTWKLPALGAVTATTAVLVRPDGYVAWVGDLTQLGLADALTIWSGALDVA